MTFRTRTVQKRKRRPAWQAETRRTLYVNIIFALAILAAVVALGGVLASGWYSDHLAAMATVNGQSISKDDVRARRDVLAARADRQIADYLNLRNSGKITSDEYNTLVASVQSQTGTTPGSADATTLYTTALNQLIEEGELTQYAAKNGISVTQQQIDAQVTKDSTIPEMRHVMVIGVKPETTPPSSAPTQAQVDAAKAQAQTYYDEIKNGSKKWADVQTEAGTTGAQGTTGDLGLGAKDSFSLDPDLLDAIFSLPKANDVTPILQGSDGIFRFATVTEIVPATPDPDFQTAISSSANWSSYQAEAKGEAIREAVITAVNKKYIDEPTTMRQVREIAVQSGLGQPNEDEVKAKMIVFAPNHDETSASTADQAAWTAAQQRADTAWATLQKDASQFETIAKGSENDDPYFKTAGGDVPWLPESVYTSDGTQSVGLNMAPLGTALFAPDLKPNQLIAPVKTPVGYVIAQYQGTRPSAEQLIGDASLLINSGTSFSAVAQQISQAPDANKGGDMGWVAPYQVDAATEKQIFSTPVGRLSPVFPLSNGNGSWIFEVTAEQTRLPDAAQKVKLVNSVFSNWYAEFSAKQSVWQDPAGAGSLAPSASPSAS